MNRILWATLAAATLVAAPANAALVANFELNGTLADSLGGPDITNFGTLGATGITFGAGEGPSLGGFSNTGVYSIEIGFSFTDVNGYRRLVDFKDRTSDTGAYVLSGALNFFNIQTAPVQDFVPNVQNTVVLTRDAAGIFSGYVDGNLRLSFADTSSLAVINSTIQFFNDDFVVSGEQSGGFVDFIRIYDTAIVPGASTVPEPTSWALMIAGFAMTGAAMRRRSVATA